MFAHRNQRSLTSRVWILLGLLVTMVVLIIVLLLFISLTLLRIPLGTRHLGIGMYTVNRRVVNYCCEQKSREGEARLNL